MRKSGMSSVTHCSGGRVRNSRRLDFSFFLLRERFQMNWPA